MKAKPLLEKIAITLMLAGIVFLCQPFWFGLYRYGFTVLLAGTLSFVVISHLRDPKPSEPPGEGPGGGI